MNINLDWVPMKWPSGPLQISSRAKAQTLTAEVHEVLQAWHAPAGLELLRGTPVNCLIVDWAAGEPEDLAQQTTLIPLIKAGREMGISFIGKVSVKDAEEQAIAAGLRAGVSAVLLEEPPKRPSTLPVILRSARSKVPWDSISSIFSVTENRWPGIGMTTMRGVDAITGPTGIPWVDSNGWFSLLAHQLGRGKTFWVEIDPPDSLHSLHPPNYCLPLVDSQAYGSRWIISLDDKLRSGMMKKDPEATSLWHRIVAAISFFNDRSEWQRFQPSGVLAVISDFRGENEYLAGEVLNLLSRRHVQYKIIERPQVLSAPLEGLKAIGWLDRNAPSAESQSRLLAFIRRGGFLVASSSWQLSEGNVIEGDFSHHYELRRVGRGQVAVARQEFQDPYQVAVDMHLMLSRRNDLVRLYNAGTTNCYCSFDPKSPAGLVQILNYSSSGPANFVTLWARTQNRWAQLWTLDAKQAVSIRGTSAEEGVEFDLPPISLYLALAFDNGAVR